MIRFTNSQVLPIGVDIGHDSIKMLQLEISGDGLTIRAAARMAVPDEVRALAGEARLAASCDLIRQMLRQNPFSGRRIVAALPRSIVNVKNLRLPSMPPDELTSAIEFEARTIFPFDADAAHIRHLPAGEVRQGADAKQEIIVLAVKHIDVDNYLEQLNRCGVIVESLDFEPSALYRSIERFIRRREDENEVNVLIDVGMRTSQVIIGKGRDMNFFKPIDIGGERMNQAVCKKLGITIEEARALRKRLVDTSTAGQTAESAKRDPVRQAVFDATRSIMEDLGREISLCLRYYSVTFRGQRPTRVRLLGGEANDPQLQAVLNATLPIPVEVTKPLNNVNLGQMKPADRRGSLCEWTVAMGLSLKPTKKNFAALDGKPRDNTKQSLAEVVDLNNALSETSGAPAPEADASKASKPEAAHA